MLVLHGGKRRLAVAASAVAVGGRSLHASSIAAVLTHRASHQDRPIGNNSEGVVPNQVFRISELEVPLHANATEKKVMHDDNVIWRGCYLAAEEIALMYLMITSRGCLLCAQLAPVPRTLLFVVLAPLFFALRSTLSVDDSRFALALSLLLAASLSLSQHATHAARAHSCLPHFSCPSLRYRRSK